jgi:hypothetical protein
MFKQIKKLLNQPLDSWIFLVCGVHNAAAAFLANLIPIFSIIVCLGMPGPYRDANAALGTPVLKWSRCWPGPWCETGWYASPAAADIDGDGQTELLWGAYTLIAVNGSTGVVEWHASSPGGGRLWPGIVIADLDHNGSLEIVTGNGAGYISVYTGTGSNYPGWPVQPTGTGNEIRSLAVADIDGNRDLEIIVCSTRSDNQWFVYEHTGGLRGGWPKMTDSDSNGYAAGCYNENVGVADIDGDGRGEIIGPNDTHYTAAFNDDGTPVRASAIYGQVGQQNKPWARVGVHVDHAVDLRGYANCGTEHRPNFAASAPSIADLNGDGALEIVIVGNVYNCGTNPYTNLYEMPFIFNANRTRWSGDGYHWTAIPLPDAAASPLSEDYSIIENNQPNPVLADLDGDGFKEVLHPSYDGRVHAYWLDKTEKYGWPFAVYAGAEYRFASEPVVADLDGDVKGEVLFTTWTEKGSNQRGDLKIVNWQAVQLFNVPLPPTGDDSGGALPAPTLANIDGDADLEVLIGSTHTGLLAYDLPGTAYARILWGTGRGGFQRKGQAPRVTIQGMGVFRDGGWYLDTGNVRWDNCQQDQCLRFGWAGDQPVVGDWDGNGFENIGVRRGNRWYLDDNGNGVWDGADQVHTFGWATDQPVVGDWNGDGRAEIGVKRGNRWYLDYTGNGVWDGGDQVHTFGWAADQPVVGDWNGDGLAGIGTRRGNTWYLDYDGNGAWNRTIDYSSAFGSPGDKPVPGYW